MTSISNRPVTPISHPTPPQGPPQAPATSPATEAPAAAPPAEAPASPESPAEPAVHNDVQALAASETMGPEPTPEALQAMSAVAEAAGDVCLTPEDLGSAIIEEVDTEPDLGAFGQAIAGAAPGSQASIRLTAGVRVGAPTGTTPAGVSASFQGTAELSVSRGTGVGAPYVATLNLGVEAQAQIRALGSEISLEFANSWNNGVAFYNAEQVEQFAGLSANLMTQLGSGDRQGVSDAMTALSDFAEDHRFQSTTLSGTVAAIVADGQTGFSLSHERSNSVLESYDDANQNGQWDFGEASLQETVREESYRGTFHGQIAGQNVAVTVATTSAVLEERVTDPLGLFNEETERGTESSQATRVRLTLSPETLRLASDSELIGLIESGLSSLPNAAASGLTGAEIRGFIPGLREASSRENRAGSIVFEVALLSETNHETNETTYTPSARFGLDVRYRAELEVPVAAVVQAVGSVEISSTYLMPLER